MAVLSSVKQTLLLTHRVMASCVAIQLASSAWRRGIHV